MSGRRLLCVLMIVPLFVLGCGTETSLVTCANGIVVFDGVDCMIVEDEFAGLASDVRAEIDELRAEASADPTVALANSQTIARLMSTAPFSVCAALQTAPGGEFLTTETIAPIAAALAQTTCPSAAELR